MSEKFKRFKVLNSNILRYLIAVNNKLTKHRLLNKKNEKEDGIMKDTVNKIKN